MRDAPLVSVIVLNFNGAAILPRCLDHLLAQTHAPREILVVDNASSDGSDAVLAAYALGDEAPHAHGILLDVVS